MTPDTLAKARKRLRLTAADLARALHMPGRDPGRLVRRYETGAAPIPGPVQAAVELLLELQALRKAQEGMEVVSATLAHLQALPAPSAPLKTRRRGFNPAATRDEGQEPRDRHSLPGVWKR